MKNKISEEFEDFAYLGKVCLVFSGRKTSGHFRKSSENNEIRLRLSEIFGINLFTNSACQVPVLKKRFFFFSNPRQTTRPHWPPRYHCVQWCSWWHPDRTRAGLGPGHRVRPGTPPLITGHENSSPCSLCRIAHTAACRGTRWFAWQPLLIKDKKTNNISEMKVSIQWKWLVEGGGGGRLTGTELSLTRRKGTVKYREAEGLRWMRKGSLFHALRRDSVCLICKAKLFKAWSEFWI